MKSGRKEGTPTTRLTAQVLLKTAEVIEEEGKITPTHARSRIAT